MANPPQSQSQAQSPEMKKGLETQDVEKANDLAVTITGLDKNHEYYLTQGDKTVASAKKTLDNYSNIK